MAGDEITEAISDQYLLDFPVAERSKRDIVCKGKAVVTDILGFDREVTIEEMIHHIYTPIEQLAASIAEEILCLNSKAPKAVMLIGGGSLTPKLPKLNDQLQLVKKKQQPFIFQDIFRFIEFSTEKTRGNYRLLKNGLTTSFDAEIHHGDQLAIEWF